MILFLDFDGVLHPDSVYLQGGQPVLRAEGRLFQWAPLLVEALLPAPDVHIVLSTSWVRWLGFRNAKSALPIELQSRVIGATWHSRIDLVEWETLSRHGQIRRYLVGKPTNWLALDDDDTDWAAVDQQRLVRCDGNRGIGDQETLAQLRRVLVEMTQ